MSNSPWRKFLDVIGTYPRYERVQNYIAFINAKKVQSMTNVVKSLCAIGMGGIGTNTDP